MSQYNTKFKNCVWQQKVGLNENTILFRLSAPIDLSEPLIYLCKMFFTC